MATQAVIISRRFLGRVSVYICAWSELRMYIFYDVNVAVTLKLLRYNCSVLFLSSVVKRTAPVVLCRCRGGAVVAGRADHIRPKNCMFPQKSVYRAIFRV